MLTRESQDVMEKVADYYRPWSESGERTWRSSISQEVRFESIERLLPDREISLLDVGCGTADMLAYLHERRVVPVRYTGVDLLPGMVEKARVRFPDEQFAVGTLDVLEEGKTFDWVTAVGIFLTFGTEAYMQEMIWEMWKRCDEGIAFTCLQKPPDLLRAEQGETAFAREVPLGILEKLTSRVILDASYAPHCYTIAAWKTESRWLKEWKRSGGW